MRRHVRKLLPLILVVIIGVGLSGCQSATRQPDMSGTWYVTLTNLANEGYTSTMRFDISQFGSNLSGVGFLLGEPIGTMSGTITLDKFSFRLIVADVHGGGFGDFTGVVSGNSLSGNYTASGGGYGPISGSRSVGTSGTLAPTGGVGVAELLSRR